MYEMFFEFLASFKHYLIEVLPALAVGFFLSGLIHEFIPTAWINAYLGRPGIRSILYATLAGAILPICCWGSLPVAVSFYKKGAKLGPVLAFLVATPATSVTAVLVTYRVLGLKITVFLFFGVILMGILIGLVGNVLKFTPRMKREEICPHCEEEIKSCVCGGKFTARIRSVLKFAFVDMVKEIGPPTLVGLILASIVAAAFPIGRFIGLYLGGVWGYIFGLVFGLVMYICSTASPPLADAFLSHGMNVGGGIVLLLAGPVTSFGTIIVLGKEFGIKILLTYLGLISIISLLLGYCFSLLP